MYVICQCLAYCNCFEQRYKKVSLLFSNKKWNYTLVSWFFWLGGKICIIKIEKWIIFPKSPHVNSSPDGWYILFGICPCMSHMQGGIQGLGSAHQCYRNVGFIIQVIYCDEFKQTWVAHPGTGFSTVVENMVGGGGSSKFDGGLKSIHGGSMGGGLKFCWKIPVVEFI